ncbi:MAG: hypothetical protein H8E44_16120 [Planctomycetes bacterium]|nr:hypothetical protein [Planctomycetota bacterium]
MSLLRVVFEDEPLAKWTHWYYWRVAQEGPSPLYRGHAKLAPGASGVVQPAADNCRMSWRRLSSGVLDLEPSQELWGRPSVEASGSVGRPATTRWLNADR